MEGTPKCPLTKLLLMRWSAPCMAATAIGVCMNCEMNDRLLIHNLNKYYQTFGLLWWSLDKIRFHHVFRWAVSVLRRSSGVKGRTSFNLRRWACVDFTGVCQTQCVAVELAVFWWSCGFIHRETEWQCWLGTSDTVCWKMTCNRLLLRKNSLSPAVCLWALQSYRWEYKTERGIESNRLRLIDWQREVKMPGIRAGQKRAPERRCQLEGVRAITSPLKGKRDERSFLDSLHHAHHVPEGWIHKVYLNWLSGMKFKNDFPQTLDRSPLRIPCLKTNLKSAHLILFQTWRILLTVKAYRIRWIFPLVVQTYEVISWVINFLTENKQLETNYIHYKYSTYTKWKWKFYPTSKLKRTFEGYI